MRVRRSWLVLGMLLITTAASADDHRADLFAAFSFARGSKIVGFHEAYAYALELPKPIDHNLSLVGDFSVHFGSLDGNDVMRVAFMVGPRLTIARNLQSSKLSVHALAGTVYTNDAADSGPVKAVTVGGGWEFLPPADRAALKPWGVRVQVDYTVRFGDADNFPRASVGVIYRFKRRQQ